tara:strand:+ start:18850 stop:20280 length:1431 start_codon:yes stop_codon:yes gene_type:complete
MSIGVAWTGVVAIKTCIRQPSKRHLPRPLIWLGLLLLWLTASLAWTEDMTWGLRILGLQWPLWVLLAAWHVMPLGTDDGQTARRWVMGSAMLAMAGALAWGSIQWLQGQPLEGRGWSPWMSHIRLSLLAALAMGWNAKESSGKALGLFALIWGGFTLATGSLTSVLLVPLTIGWVLLQRVAPHHRPILLSIGLVGTLVVAVGMGNWLRPVPLPQEAFPSHTEWGNAFVHRPDRVLSEGGHRLHILMCQQEWEEAWSQVSQKPLDEQNDAGYTIRPRLWRYLTSKGWPKDGEHIVQLRPSEVKAIEQGATNVQPRSGLAQRLHAFRWEYETWKDGGNPSGHSLFQRFEHWRAGWHGWNESLLWGHGIGDAEAAIQRSYLALETPLSETFRHRPHMQYLTLGMTGGCMALALWLAFASSWLWRFRRHAVAQWAWLLVSLSFLFEDTLETQAGVALVGLAFALGSRSFSSGARHSGNRN